MTARCVKLVASHANSGTSTDKSVLVAQKIVTLAAQKLSVQPAIMAISSTQMDHALRSPKIRQLQTAIQGSIEQLKEFVLCV